MDSATPVKPKAFPCLLCKRAFRSAVWWSLQPQLVPIGNYWSLIHLTVIGEFGGILLVDRFRRSYWYWSVLMPPGYLQFVPSYWGTSYEALTTTFVNAYEQLREGDNWNPFYGSTLLPFYGSVLHSIVSAYCAMVRPLITGNSLCVLHTVQIPRAFEITSKFRISVTSVQFTIDLNELVSGFFIIESFYWS